MGKEINNLSGEELSINVVGHTNSGKSSLMLMIQKMLNGKGFTIETNYLDEELLNDNQLMGRDSNILKQNKKIIINEVQAKRKI